MHAAGESVREPVPPGTYAVVLAVPNEDGLLKVYQDLTTAEIPCVLIREPDRNNEAMTIGVVPCDRSKVKRVLGRLPLLKETT